MEKSEAALTLITIDNLGDKMSVYRKGPTPADIPTLRLAHMCIDTSPDLEVNHQINTVNMAGAGRPRPVTSFRRQQRLFARRLPVMLLSPTIIQEQAQLFKRTPHQNIVLYPLYAANLVKVHAIGFYLSHLYDEPAFIRSFAAIVFYASCADGNFNWAFHILGTVEDHRANLSDSVDICVKFQQG